MSALQAESCSEKVIFLNKPWLVYMAVKAADLTAGQGNWKNYLDFIFSCLTCFHFCFLLLSA